MSGANKPPSKHWQAGLREASPYVGLGLQVAMSMVFFTGGGYLLDRWLGTLPWLTVVGAFLGMAAIGALLVRITQDLSSTSTYKAPKAEKSPPSVGDSTLPGRSAETDRQPPENGQNTSIHP